MPLYDYRCQDPRCPDVDVEFERAATISERHNQKCYKCDQPLEKLDRPAQTSQKPFHNYFDEGLGEFITGKHQRRRVMRDLKMDFRDHMSIGDRTARKDKSSDMRRERVKLGLPPRT